MRKSLLRTLTTEPPHVTEEVEKIFGDNIDLFSTGGSPPKGVTTVSTTFDIPGPLEVPMEIHGGECRFPKTLDQLDCTCGWYHLFVLGKR